MKKKPSIRDLQLRALKHLEQILHDQGAVGKKISDVQKLIEEMSHDKEKKNTTTKKRATAHKTAVAKPTRKEGQAGVRYV